MEQTTAWFILVLGILLYFLEDLLWMYFLEKISTHRSIKITIKTAKSLGLILAILGACKLLGFPFPFR